jgi:hypothetical protein
MFRGRRLCPDGVVRVIPPGPLAPRLIGISDSVDLLSATRIRSGMIKAIVEDASYFDDLTASVAGHSVREFQKFQTDPLTERHEIDFRIPPAVPAGTALLEIHLGKRRLARNMIEVMP